MEPDSLKLTIEQEFSLKSLTDQINKATPEDVDILKALLIETTKMLFIKDSIIKNMMLSDLKRGLQ